MDCVVAPAAAQWLGHAKNALIFTAESNMTPEHDQPKPAARF